MNESVFYRKPGTQPRTLGVDNLPVCAMKNVVLSIAYAASVTLAMLICLTSITKERNEAMKRAADQLRASTAALATARAQLERDDRIISQLLDGWDRSAPVFRREVTVTSYTSRPEETDSTPYITACNTRVVVGGIAVSRDLFEELGGCGKKVVLTGYGSLTINDKLNRRYRNSIDIWTGDLKAAILHGRRTATLMWQ